MSSLTHKRRRSTIAFVPDGDNSDREAGNSSDDSRKVEEKLYSGIWGAFCEEYHEVLEQLPLTLQRAFILIRELDDQAQSNNATLVDYLRRYLQTRTNHGGNGGISMTTSSLPSSSSRGLISRAASIAEENSRAAQERVNIAQSVYDTIDRQIRLLDQSIEEVEAVIVSANHPDSQPRRILSYAVTGRWLRPQVEPPPQPSDNQSSRNEPPSAGFSVQKANPASIRKTRKGKKRKNVIEEHKSQPGITTIGDVVVHEPDPNEPRYCYCNNVSYGAMVQCENPAKCPRDWFHYDCIGLKKAPKGKWFCPTCKPEARGVSRKAQI